MLAPFVQHEGEHLEDEGVQVKGALGKRSNGF